MELNVAKAYATDLISRVTDEVCCIIYRSGKLQGGGKRHKSDANC